MIRVAVVDDHPHVAVALRTLLAGSPDIQLVAESRRGQEVPSLIRKTSPDVLLLDVFIESDFDALSTVRCLGADFPNIKICLHAISKLRRLRVRGLGWGRNSIKCLFQFSR